MVYHGQRVIRYLYTWKKGLYVEIKPSDKVIIKTKDKIISGEISQIGTKYLTLRISPEYRYKPNRKGRVASWVAEQIKTDDIKNIAVYPECSQRYGYIDIL